MRQKTFLAVATLVLGTFVGLASASTNSVPLYSDQSLIASVGLFLAGATNSFVAWFAIPLALGYFICASRKQALLAGAMFMTAAILANYIGGLGDQPSIRHLDHDTGNQLFGQLSMLAIAVPGGLAAGAAGWYARKYPALLATLFFFIFVEIVRRGPVGWQSPISMAENIFFILVALIVALHIGYRLKMDLTSSNRKT